MMVAEYVWLKDNFELRNYFLEEKKIGSKTKQFFFPDSIYSRPKGTKFFTLTLPHLVSSLGGNRKLRFNSKA